MVKKPPECWIVKQPEKSKKKLYGIWARYNKPTQDKIEKECGPKVSKEKKRKGAKKRIGKG